MVSEKTSLVSTVDPRVRVDSIIRGLIQDDEWAAGEFASHVEQLFRDQHVAMTGMERWYLRYEWITRQVEKGLTPQWGQVEGPSPYAGAAVEYPDTYGLEPLQSNWDAVCHMLVLYSPIDSDLWLADSVRRSQAMTSKVRKEIARKLRVKQREQKRQQREEVYEHAEFTDEEIKEIQLWAATQATERGYRSRRIYLNDGKTLSSRSASLRHASRRQRQREQLAKKHPQLSAADIEKLVDPRGKGYLTLDRQILQAGDR